MLVGRPRGDKPSCHEAGLQINLTEYSIMACPLFSQLSGTAHFTQMRAKIRQQCPVKSGLAKF